MRLAGLPRWAASGAGLWSSLSSLLLPPAPQSAGGLPGLLEIFIAGAPEDDTARHGPDRDRHIQFAGHAKEIVFHALHGDLRAQVDAHSVARQGLNLLSQRL